MKNPNEELMTLARAEQRRRALNMSKRTVEHPTHRTTARSQRVDASVLIRGLTKSQRKRISRYVATGPYEETIAGRRWRFETQEDGRIGVKEIDR